MKTSKIVLMIVFLAMAVLLTGFMVFALVTDFDFGGLVIGTGGKMVTDEYTITELVDSVDVDWGSEDVTIRPHDSDEIYMRHTRPEKIKPIEYKVSGKKLNISSRKSSFILFAFKVNSTLDIYLPRKEYEEIKVKLGGGEADISDLEVKSFEIKVASGDIVVRDLKSDDVSVNVSSGEINFSNFDVSGKLEVKVASGNIIGSGLTANTIKADVTSGEIKADGKFENVEFDITSGDVSIKNSVLPKTMDGKVTSGNMNVSIPENDGFSLNFKKTSGDFNSDFDLMKSMNGGIYVYKEGGNDDINYNIKITSGSVRLNKKN